MEPVGPRNWRQISAEMGKTLRGHTRGIDVLFHGTILWRTVARTNVLLQSVPGFSAVSLTRPPDIAAYWACMPRDVPWDPGILVLDRPSLVARYRLQPNDYWAGDPTSNLRIDECEEWIVGRDLRRLNLHVVGVLHLEGHLRGKPRFVCDPCDAWSGDWPLLDMA